MAKKLGFAKAVTELGDDWRRAHNKMRSMKRKTAMCLSAGLNSSDVSDGIDMYCTMRFQGGAVAFIKRHTV
jgi:hypothetical protein